MKTGNTLHHHLRRHHQARASMEPGHEDREYADQAAGSIFRLLPQWSPVMKTGNTNAQGGTGYLADGPQWSPVMKTGNTHPRNKPPTSTDSLNGARS